MDLLARRACVAILALLVTLATGHAAAQGVPLDDPDAEIRTLTLREPADGPQVVGPALSWSAGSGGSGSWQRGIAVDFLPAGILPEGDIPTAAKFTPDGATIVIAHAGTRNLLLIEAATRARIGEIPLSGTPTDLALSSDGLHAVTTNLWEDTVSIVDLGAATEVAVVPVGDQPGVVRITPDGTTAIVGNAVDQDLSIIDLASATELRRITGAGFVSTTRITFESGVVTVTFNGFECADDRIVVHADFVNDEVDFFDVQAGTVSSVPVATRSREVAITPDGATAVVTHTSSTQLLSVIDVASQTVVDTIATGIDLWGPVSIRPDASKAAAGVQNGVVVIDLSTGTVSPKLSTASANGILTTADGRHALVVGFTGSLVSYATESIVSQLNNVVNTYVGAVSPTEDRAVLISNHNGEDLLVVDTDGASGFLEDLVPTGPPPEGDRTRMAAVSPDGSRAVTTNILSHTATVLDLESGLVEGIVDVGSRPAEVEISRDGRQAVVASLDSSQLSIIDLDALDVTPVTLSTRQSEVEISPDGQYAYVAVVSSGDGVWRVNLGTLAVDGPRLTTGDMGSVSMLFSQTSGLTLSHDGATLVTCDSFSDTITIIDTSSWSIVKTLAVGDFPVRALFTADDSTLYVSNRNDDTITVVDVNGTASQVTGSVAVGDWPFEMVLAANEQILYVGNFQDHDIGVVDLSSNVMVRTIPLRERVQGLERDPTGTYLFASAGTWSVSIGPGPKISVNTFGAFTVLDTATETVVDEWVGDQPPGQLVLNACASQALIPVPFADSLQAIDLDPVPGLRLEVTPTLLDPLDDVTFTTCPGSPGDPVLVAAVEIAGVRNFHTLAVSAFGPLQMWTVTATIPPGLAGLDIAFRSYALGLSGRLEVSNIERVLFR